jgi:hypothetical protein
VQAIVRIAALAAAAEGADVVNLWHLKVGLNLHWGTGHPPMVPVANAGDSVSPDELLGSIVPEVQVSQQVQAAFQQSFEKASGRNDDVVQPADLLEAFRSQLQRYGESPDDERLRGLGASDLPSAIAAGAPRPRRTVSETLLHVTMTAAAHARDLGDVRIHSGHGLLALLDNPETVAAKLLTAQFGVDVDGLRDLIRQRLADVTAGWDDP